jgi:hypothetical protein
MSNTKEVIAGAVAVALPLWVRAQDDTDRDLRNNRLDLRDLESELRACCNHGAMIRSKLAIAQDVGVGLALSNPKTTVPEILPTSTPYTRAVIGEDTINDYKYPPRVGNYLPNGALTEAGEMTRLFLALAFQENRAWIEGFTLPGSPAPSVTAQIFSASRALSTVISGLTLSRSEWISAWKQLFESGLQAIGTPTIGNLNAANNVQSVQPIGGATFTNRAMRIRVTATGSGSIGASTDVATVAFSKSYPAVPAVVGSDGLSAINVTTTGFTIQLSNAINPGLSREFSIVVGV